MLENINDLSKENASLMASYFLNDGDLEGFFKCVKIKNDIEYREKKEVVNNGDKLDA